MLDEEQILRDRRLTNLCFEVADRRAMIARAKLNRAQRTSRSIGLKREIGTPTEK